ncbi:MAG: flavodoxin domain-containing protein [Bacillota bacterium]|nr:flavodoxin domain-containing protein [Bacillota bacterium]
MKTEVIYLSKTGHSRKIARAIAAEFHNPPGDINGNPRLSDVDLLFIVGGIYGGVSSPKMLEYAGKLKNTYAKRVALVTSCASAKMKQDQVRTILEQNGIVVMPDEFVCRGSFLFFHLGHPSKKEVADAVAFAKRMVQTVQDQ